VSQKWKNWYQNEVDEETKGADYRDKVKHNERLTKVLAWVRSLGLLANSLTVLLLLHFQFDIKYA